MKLQIWTCILCIETALALYFGVSAVRSYGLAASLTCLESRSSLTLSRCAKASMPPQLHLTPSATPMRSTSGFASWYSRASCRREGTGGARILMANGRPLDNGAMTCALWLIGKHGRPLKPDGRLVKISLAKHGLGKAVICVWTDNGPGSVPRSEGVICDLTPRAMRALAGEDGIREGRVEVTVEGI